MIEQIVSLQQKGLKRAEIAEAVGLTENQVKYQLELSRKPGGIRDALRNTKLDGSRPMFGWRKVKNPDGSSDSVFWKADKETEQPEELADRIADRINKIRPIAPIVNNKISRDDIANFIPLFDVHLSMRIGQYGLDDAVTRISNGFCDIIDRAPHASACYIVNGGDFTHQNDDSNQTPRNKHPLPVDEDYLNTTDLAIDITVEMIDIALANHDKVVYKALRGNHDENTAYILRAALIQRYRNNPRVIILDDDLHFFAESIGNNAIFAAHGDIKKPPRELCMSFMARYKSIYGAAEYSELHTGHRHHWSAQDFPGMLFEQHRAICPSDTYAIENLYEAPSQMQAITYKLSGGRYGTVTHAF